MKQVVINIFKYRNRKYNNLLHSYIAYKRFDKKEHVHVHRGIRDVTVK